MTTTIWIIDSREAVVLFLELNHKLLAAVQVYANSKYTIESIF